jgi:hypothetical protein
MKYDYLTLLGKATFFGKTLGFALFTFLQFLLYLHAH